MKKIICIAVALLVLSLGTAMAAPLNDLSKGQTAVGVATDNLYIEHKIADRFTIGLQNIDVTSDDDEIDLYAQYRLNNTFRAIVGHRDISGGAGYLGIGATRSLDNNWDGHAYVLLSDEFVEAQVGATYKITSELDANVYFRSFMPDEGKDKNRLGVGITYKF